ncbi:urea transport system substrate-binding protein [Anaerocolumna jejuensis DSM 15929]|uniref:Urea transport system substrate-binding protein n=1 Tax=Anaerocolumna jejuensis DSM 15929 TaxID=1121322 RepID=A0A1M6TA20_9FIRM|nr:transporter substrate-binding domain-containing protein [Anaerocolumna jejuensis]SHK53817.1 urea transport system substrate-binding protein [Anaerocolumna jejuensis DSM 15929]
MKSKKIFAMALALLLVFMGAAGCSKKAASSSDSIKIGLVFSLTGGTAISEECMYNSAVLAIEQINAKGGVNGKKIEYVVKDYATDADKAAKVVKEMILEDKVSAIVGLYTSSSRVAVEPILEEYKVPLIYPTFYEGETPNQYVVYTGSVPNQQGDYFVPYLMENVSKNFYLIGTDTTYAASINKQAKELIGKLGGSVIGENLVPSSTTEFSDVIAKIKDTTKDEGCVIYCNLNGDSGTAFYTQFAAAGLSDKYTIASFIMDESFSTALGSAAVNTYASVNYFNSIDSEANKAFLSDYAKKYGEEKKAAVTAVGESTYDAVYLLSMALEKCGDKITADNILTNFNDLTFEAPQGTIKVDAKTHHIYCKARVGQVQADGTIKTVFESDEVIAPEPAK